MFGCFSTARLVAKVFHQLNVYKIGSGYADTENIYSSISKPLGVLVGAIDITKSYVYLFMLESLLRHTQPSLATQTWMMIFGFMMLLGHCLPITHHFKGRRGTFTYAGYIGYFIFWPVLIVGVLSLVFFFVFKQLRFGQYVLVITPPFLALLFGQIYRPLVSSYSSSLLIELFAAAFLMGLLNLIVSKRLGEI